MDYLQIIHLGGNFVSTKNALYNLRARKSFKMKTKFIKRIRDSGGDSWSQEK